MRFDDIKTFDNVSRNFLNFQSGFHDQWLLFGSVSYTFKLCLSVCSWLTLRFTLVNTFSNKNIKPSSITTRKEDEATILMEKKSKKVKSPNKSLIRIEHFEIQRDRVLKIKHANNRTSKSYSLYCASMSLRKTKINQNKEPIRGWSDSHGGNCDINFRLLHSGEPSFFFNERAWQVFD